MKKLGFTKTILWIITVLGGFLVTQGLITGEELTEIENIIGVILAGGGLTANGLILLISAIPGTLVAKGYQKAVDVYGEKKVNNVLDNFDVVIQKLDAFDELGKTLLAEIKLDREIKHELGVYDDLPDELKDKL